MRENTIYLRKNEDIKSDSSPIMKGSGQVNGTEYWAAGWKNEDKEDGGSYLTIKLTSKEEARQQSSGGSKESSAEAKDDDDDVPF